MGRESATCGDPVVINHAQRAEAHMLGIVVVGEGKRVPAVEPAVIRMAALSGAADIQFGVRGHAVIIVISNRSDNAFSTVSACESRRLISPAVPHTACGRSPWKDQGSPGCGYCGAPRPPSPHIPRNSANGSPGRRAAPAV